MKSITVPPASAGLVYQFNYDANSKLASISAPGIGGSRVTTITQTATPGVIARITDPDGSHVDFGYITATGSGALMDTVTDRRGTRTVLDPEASSPTLAASHTPIGAQEVLHSFRNAVAMGAAPGTAPIVIDSVYTRYDGPRTDVADVVKIWLGAFDIPVKVVDPIGATTTVTYGDARFPLLATRVSRPRGRLTAPDSLVTAAAYDARGNIVADTVYNPLGDGRNAVTTYGWDPKWDKVTRIVSPTGIVTESAYDTSNANLLWTQTGGPTYRDSLFYYNTTLAAGLLHWSRTPTINSSADSSETRYDTILGNPNYSRTQIGYISLSYSDALGRDTLAITPIDTALKNNAGSFVNVRDSTLQTGTRVRTHYDIADEVTDQWTENGPNATAYQFAAETLQVHTDYDAGGLIVKVKRRAIPDPNATRWISDSSAYDALGRDTLDIGAATVRRRYDLAGNVVWTNHGDSSVYDARGLRTKHLLPAVSWLARDSSWYMEELNGAPADSETYSYGLAGELFTANNRYAQIRRSYYPNGALHGDTSTVVAYGSSSPPNTPLEFDYDLEGRRTRLRHSLISGAAAGAPRDSVQYSYDPLTGVLSQVIDPKGFAFTYTQDADGRLTSLAFPGRTDSYRYDRDSRLRWINGDSLKRDARGKVIWEQGSPTTAVYSALGNLLKFTHGTADEDYAPDVLGNSPSANLTGSAPGTEGYWTKLYNSHGALASQKKRRDVDPYANTMQPDVGSDFDQFGNQSGGQSYAYAMRQMAPAYPGVDDGMRPVVDTTNTWSYYDADNHLRYTLSKTLQRYMTTSLVYTDTMRIKTWEYRYDALGRRVMMRYRGPIECQNTNSTECRATLDYQTWDGSQLLADSRAVESGGVNAASTTNLGGLAVYTQGAQLDVPLSIYRDAGSGCLFTLSPRSDWRGVIVSGNFDSTQPSCARVTYPGNALTAYRQGPGVAATAPWNGSLIDAGTDQSGLQYMRNRYFNPATGQFTQADPIGIAGGLNVYGYARGDPVSYSDPFGLCPRGGDGVAAGLASLQCALEELIGGIIHGPSEVAHSQNPLGGRFAVELAMVPLTVVGGEEEAGAAGIRLMSKIGESKALVRAAETLEGTLQASVDRLTARLAAGNMNPGISNRYLFKGIFEARARDGARVYFRNVGNNVIEILAKSSKANQEQVIQTLRRLYQ